MSKKGKKSEKTLIGVLASHDNTKKNESLARLLENLSAKEEKRDLLENFAFIFTGGTYARVIESENGVKGVNDDTKDFLLNECGLVRLPPYSKGGVIMLAFLLTQRKVSIIWPFYSPTDPHWIKPENLALMRLCDQWHVKKLMNSSSVEEWFEYEAIYDRERNLQDLLLTLPLKGNKKSITFNKVQNSYNQGIGKRVECYTVEDRAGANEEFGQTLALIAHDQMKDRMVDFAVDCERELATFGKILSTGTTGKVVADNAQIIADKIKRYHSGPKGGDIEIATEVLVKGCDVITFFIDPLNPHPHIDDIRVVFAACMIQDEVRMLSNEMQAREWMDRVIKRGS